MMDMNEQNMTMVEDVVEVGAEVANEMVKNPEELIVPVVKKQTGIWKKVGVGAGIAGGAALVVLAWEKAVKPGAKKIKHAVDSHKKAKEEAKDQTKADDNNAPLVGTVDDIKKVHSIK